MTNTIKACFTTIAIAAGCVGIVYIIIKRKYKLQNAIDALKYLKIHVITDEKECHKIVRELLRSCQKCRALGFDCEWVSEGGRRQPVALLQLSTYDGVCGLFRLNLLTSIPQSLQMLLEDESIYKLGVAPLDDARYLCEDYSIVLKSIVDIRHVVEVCGYSSGGLATLSRNHLGILLDKSWRVRCSDWEAKELTERQVKYAAADAHVAIRIFFNLFAAYKKQFVYSFLKWKRNGENYGDLDKFVENFVDMGYKQNQAIKKEPNINKKVSSSYSKKNSNAIRTKPLYHNSFLQAPDGELLCTCDPKKAYWYVEKQLADLVQEDPLTVRLRFEPAGRSVGDVGRYYQITKENKCVVCGSTNSYIRKNVVPREYRKYFPEIMKDHASHDVVLLCSTCHQRSNMRDLTQRLRLAADCEAPLSNHASSSKYLEDADCKKVRSAARALLYQSRKHQLPEERRAHMEGILLKRYPHHAIITEDLLEEAANVKVIYENTEYECHGEKVVEHYLHLDRGLLLLEQQWRQHFLDTMKPKYMPELWSINHNEERLRVKFDEGRLSKEDMKSVGMTEWIS